MTGRSASLRKSELQTSNPDHLEIVYEIEVSDAPKVESTLHRLFNSKRLINEWFSLTEDDVKKFKPLCEKINQDLIFLKKNSTFKL